MFSKKNLIIGLIAIIVLFILAELTLFLPAFKPNNPPVTAEVAWNSAEAEAIFRDSCADCHSNETVYPWYSYVVPVAWLVNHDVQEGREKLNISTGNIEEVEEIEEVIMEGEMPPQAYLITHPDAALSDAEIAALVTGLESSLGVSGESHEREDDEDGDDD